MLHVISHGITPQGGIICSYFTPMTLPIAMPFIWIKFHHLISHQTWQLTISCHKVRCTDLLIINNGWIISEKKIAATTTKTSQYVVSFFFKKKKKKDNWVVTEIYCALLTFTNFRFWFGTRWTNQLLHAIFCLTSKLFSLGKVLNSTLCNFNIKRGKASWIVSFQG